MIEVPEEEYLRELQSKPRYFDHGFLLGFTQMLNHVHHQSNNGINTIQSIHCMYGHRGKKTVISRRDCIPLKRTITKVVSIWHLHAHFVAMEMEIQGIIAMGTDHEHGNYKMVVFDGYNIEKQNVQCWIPHAISTVQQHSKGWMD